MTFGTMAAWQAWVLVGGAAAAAAALFFVRVRPPQVTVPSLLLWRRVLDESRDLTLWERIRRAVSLVVTVLIAVALALAAARPRPAGAAADAGPERLLVVLDSSWSMLARTRGGETRWERALAEARRLVSAASGGEIALATTADGLIEGPTTDGSLIEGRLHGLLPGDAGHNAPWPQFAGAETHFITDGALARPLDAAVAVHSVFEPADNAAITAFEVRPSLDGAGAGDAYLEIANFSAAGQAVHLTITRGGATIFDRQLDAAPAERLRQVVPIPWGGTPDVRARIRAPRDALAIDDEAVMWVERARPLAVMVVSGRPDWLRAALERAPDVRATFVNPAGYQESAAGPADADVLIFDRWAPARLPPRPALLFAPPGAASWLAGSSADDAPGIPPPPREESEPQWQTPGTHPVVAGVDPFTLAVDRARSYSSPLLVPVAASVRGTPLVSVHEAADTRLVVVGFSDDESNLATAPGFPVLLGNALEWLARPASGAAYPPGPVAFGPGVFRVTAQGGAAVPLTRVGDRVIGLLTAPGLYVAEGGGARSTIAVNAGDPQLSNLTRTSAAASGAGRQVRSGAGGRPWWVYAAAVAFCLALAEWWTWQRRITV